MVGILFWTALVFSCSSAIAEIVKVRVVHGKKSIQLSGFAMISTELGFKPSIPKQERVSVSLLNGKLQVQVGKVKTLLSQVNVVGEELRISGHRVPSKISITPSGDRRSIDVVASVDLEDYVSGVLPNEMPGLWPMEALKVQAITTRTYALKQVSVRRHEKYHLESTVLDQVFNLEAAMNIPQRIRKKVKEAVGATKDIVLLVDDKIIKAYYHADCGGQTEVAENVWGQIEKGVSSVRDPLCPLSPNGDWSTQFSATVFEGKLSEYLKSKGAVFKDDLDPYVQSLHPSGRVASVGFRGIEVSLSSQEFREAIGFSKVKSAKFKIEREGQFYKLSGAGHGHGVGMCQWGARQLVFRGLKYGAILKHYYPKAQLGKITQVQL